MNEALLHGDFAQNSYFYLKLSCEIFEHPIAWLGAGLEERPHLQF